jgi:hypothetical protein
MDAIMFLYTAVLFFILTPGIILSLPPGATKTVVALTHAVVFAVVWSFTNQAVFAATRGML